jgi:hypothetical protein
MHYVITIYMTIRSTKSCRSRAKLHFNTPDAKVMTRHSGPEAVHAGLVDSSCMQICIDVATLLPLADEADVRTVQRPCAWQKDHDSRMHYSEIAVLHQRSQPAIASD